MNAVSKAARVVTHPAQTAGSVAGRTIGLTLGAAKVGVRTTARVVGWAVERAGGPTPQHPATTYPSVTVPPTPPRTEAGADAPQADTDPILGTRTPAPKKAAAKKAATKKAAAKKVPASRVPLKSAPTPTLPAALESLDEADDVSAPAPPARPAAKKAPRKSPTRKAATKKTTTKKATTKKATTKKAPSEQAAVLAPALGLTEDEVVEAVEGTAGDADKG